MRLNKAHIEVRSCGRSPLKHRQVSVEEAPGLAGAAHLVLELYMVKLRSLHGFLLEATRSSPRADGQPLRGFCGGSRVEVQSREPKSLRKALDHLVRKVDPLELTHRIHLEVG